jgi:hypothetical protein
VALATTAEARTVEAGFHATLLPAPPPTEVPFMPTKEEEVIAPLPWFGRACPER